MSSVWKYIIDLYFFDEIADYIIYYKKCNYFRKKKSTCIRYETGRYQNEHSNDRCQFDETGIFGEYIIQGCKLQKKQKWT